MQSTQAVITCSFLLEVLESVAGLLLAGRDVALVVDVDDALGLQLLEGGLGLLVLLGQPVVVRQLLLGRGDELQLGGKLLVLVGLGLLLGRDLRLGTSALAGDLEHVRADALGHCSVKKW